MLGSKVNEVAHAMWEPTTWTQRISLMRSFIAFCDKMGLPMGTDAVPLFLESRPLKSSTKLQYGMTLRSMLTKEISLLDAYLSGCRKMAAREPIRQAVPIPKAVIDEMVDTAPAWQDAVVLRLAWITASRWAEIQALRTENFILEEDGSVILDWAALPKSSKMDPHKASRYVLIKGQDAWDLRRLIADRGPGAPVTNMTTQQATRWLKQRGYSAHSIKRGALQEAVEKASQLGISSHEVSRLGKHVTPNDVVRSTMRYLGPTAAKLGDLAQLVAEM
eukprot:gene1805-biopygen1491